MKKSITSTEAWFNESEKKRLYLVWLNSPSCSINERSISSLPNCTWKPNCVFPLTLTWKSNDYNNSLKKKARMGREKNNSLSYFSYPLIPGSQYELLIQGWYTQSRKKLQDWFKTTKSIFSASRLGLALQAQSMIAVVLDVTRHRKKKSKK